MSSAEGRRRVANVLFYNEVAMLLHKTSSLIDDLEGFSSAETKNSGGQQTCLQRTKEVFGFSLGRSYLNRFYNNASIIEQQIAQMMANVKQGILHTLESPPWREDDDDDEPYSNYYSALKVFLQDRVKNITLQLVQPDWMREPGKLEEFYEGLNFSTSSSYVRNFVEVNMWVVAKRISWANKFMATYPNITLFDTKWNFYLGGGLAYYIRPPNTIFILAAMLRDPMFVRNGPGFMNYGSLGAIMGHEIGHSIVKGVEMFWSNASEKWMRPTDLYSFHDWAAETGVLYKNFTAAVGLTHSVMKHTPTLEEDIADVLGLRGSYYAYQTYLGELEKDGKREKVLPGLKAIMTPEQLFFMKYGNVFCEKPGVRGKESPEDKHSLNIIRASLPVRLSKEFQIAFNCSSNKIPK